MKLQLKLGEMIFLLSRINPGASVRYDFGPFTPKGLDSYRGYYEQLALGHGEEKITVSQLLALLRDAVGKTFTGWKGGDYDMGESTHMWVANRGECHSTAIVGIIDCEYQAVIETAFVE